MGRYSPDEDALLLALPAGKKGRVRRHAMKHLAKRLGRTVRALSLRRWRLLRGEVQSAPRECSVDRCDGEPRSRGLCCKHYIRAYKTGAPDTPLQNRPFTPWEDEQLLSLPIAGRARRVEHGRLEDLALMLGRHKGTLCNRRRLLLRRR